MPKFHLDCGNSSEGPIGMCGVVEAKDKEEALALFVAMLPEEIDIERFLFGDERHNGQEPECFEYINVYISAENIKITEIDEEDED